MIKAIAAATVAQVILCGPAHSQAIVEPEACILDTLKGSAAKEAVNTVRFNCVRQYIKAVQSQAVGIPVENFRDSKLGHHVAIPAIPSEVPEQLDVALKNDSNMRVVMADIMLINKKTKAQHTFRGFADLPIEPRTVGSIHAIINLGVRDLNDWTWSFESVWGVPIR